MGYQVLARNTSATLCRRGRPGSRHANPAQRAQSEPHRPRLHLQRHRGIGKTTIARIVAMAELRAEIGSPERPTPEPCGTCDSCVEIRQGNAVDVIEIDAATNRGIDEIRELRDAARYAPSRDRYRFTSSTKRTRLPTRPSTPC